LFQNGNGILVFISSHFATCNNQGRHFDEGNFKNPFLSLEFVYFVLGLSNVFKHVTKVEDQKR
jgi:hypothetical protein